MRILPALLLPLLLTVFTSLHSQDTISFGGIYDLPGAEVRASYTPVSPLAQRFTVEEVYRLPGTFYDPARLVALLPGVVQTNDQANHLSVRGNTPNANLWRLNGLAIVNPNHTANAGTFYDFPTLSGGGVNAISAQMLGNSGFLSGGLPVEYGFATGGTFDLRLRPGNKTRRKYQAQAGFIGFDLMAEGPIGKSGKTSYLVNGRYSFTGLLADMGVDFGGESIRFWDFNAHLHHEWDGGEASLFAITGASSNEFTFPEDEEVTEQKELFDIDFNSNVLITGANFRHNLRRFVIKGGLAFSSVSSERDQRFASPPGNDIFIRFDVEPMINANLQTDYKLTDNSSVTVGVEYLSQDIRPEQTVFGRGVWLAGKTSGLAGFVGYEIEGEKAAFSGGVRAVKYDGPNLDVLRFEPRMLIKYGRLSFSVEGTSRVPVTALVLNRFNNPINAPINWQTTVGYERKIGRVTTASRIFYQTTPAENAVRRDFALISANNFLEFDPDYAFTTTTATRRYGVELEAAGGKKTKGWYYRGSVTLLRAETKQLSGSWNQDRYSADFIGKLTLGREWPGTDKKQRDRAYGLNLALITHGGERYGEIVAGDNFATPDVTGGFINSNGTYFRPDLRLYKTKTRKKTTTTLALDVQNAANVQNLGNVYYDAFLEQPTERYQLGLIPVLSYRIVWR